MENSNLGNVYESSGGGGSSCFTSKTRRRLSRTSKIRLPPQKFYESDHHDDDEGDGDYLADKIQQNSNKKNQLSQQYTFNLLYDCRYCTTNFSSQKDRSNHEEQWHKSRPKPYKCKIGTCPQRFSFKEDFEIHEKYHNMYEQKPENNHHKIGIEAVINFHNSEQSQLQFQQNEFPTIKLNENVNTVVNDSDSSLHIFSCELCPSRYTSKKKLKLHIKWRHTNRHQSYKEASFKTELNQDSASVPGPVQVSASSVSRKVKPSNLGASTAAVGNQETKRNYFSCTICKQDFTTYHARQVHERVHSGDLPFSCRFCSKKFPSVSRRNYHLKATACSTASCSTEQTETQQMKRQKPLLNMSEEYSCYVCGRQFTSKCSVTRHSRLHTGFKPYNCPYCPATFTRSDMLKSHLKIHSQTGRENCTHRCNICQASYQTHQALLVHWRIVHRQEELKDGHQQ